MTELEAMKAQRDHLNEAVVRLCDAAKLATEQEQALRRELAQRDLLIKELSEDVARGTESAENARVCQVRLVAERNVALAKSKRRSDLIEAAWGIIANAGEGHWEREGHEWQVAAKSWRERFHAEEHDEVRKEHAKVMNPDNANGAADQWRERALNWEKTHHEHLRSQVPAFHEYEKTKAENAKLREALQTWVTHSCKSEFLADIELLAKATALGVKARGT